MSDSLKQGPHNFNDEATKMWNIYHKNLFIFHADNIIAAAVTFLWVRPYTLTPHQLSSGFVSSVTVTHSLVLPSSNAAVAVARKICGDNVAL